MAWLQKHPLEDEAQFVLSSFLGWPQDRLGSDEAELRELAMAWLRKHPLENETGFVLNSFLGWSQARLGSDEAELRELAMAWLRKHPLEDDTGFVFAPLLGWSQDRLGSDEAELCKLAIEWLEEFSNSLEADFILKNLLPKDALSEGDRYKLCHRAIKLTEDREMLGDESHMLKTLLQLVPQRGDKVPKNEIITFACSWLDRHSVHPERIMVLARVLENLWLADHLWVALAQTALTELEARDTEKLDDFALNRVAQQVWGLDDSDQARWLRLACRWIEKWGAQESCLLLLNNYKQFYMLSIPDEVKVALNSACLRRFGGNAIDWL